MKALTLMQPWATLWVNQLKRIETRSWWTAYLGPLYVHASKGFPRWAMDLCSEEPFTSALASLGYRTPEELPRGAILGSVNMTDCHPITRGFVMGQPEATFGDFTPGRFAWWTDSSVVYAEPVPCTGALGLWTPPAEIKALCQQRAETGKIIHSREAPDVAR